MTEPIKYPSKVDHVRLRPGMYLGSKGKRALHNMLDILLDDALVEIEAGHGDHIWITLGPEAQVTIRDNGRGLPVRMTERGVPMLQSIMAESGAERKGGDYTLYGDGKGVGMGIGLVCVNALASELVATVATDGCLWTQSYRAGVPTGEVARVRDLEPGEVTGTTLTLRPDFTIFEPYEFDYALIADRAHELAYLHPNLTISLEYQREGENKSNDIRYSRGLVDFVADLNRGKLVLHDVIYASRTWELDTRGGPLRMSVQVALQYTSTTETTVMGFANNAKTYGGSHTDILPVAISVAVNASKSSEEPAGKFSPDEILPGLTAVIRVTHPQPSFDN